MAIEVTKGQSDEEGTGEEESEEQESGEAVSEGEEFEEESEHRARLDAFVLRVHYESPRRRYYRLNPPFSLVSRAKTRRERRQPLNSTKSTRRQMQRRTRGSTARILRTTRPPRCLLGLRSIKYVRFFFLLLFLMALAY